MEYFIIERR